MTETVKVEISCKKCGSKLFEMPKDPKLDDIITCAGCKASGRYGDLRQAVAGQAKEAIGNALVDTFKKAGFKVTKK